MLIPLRLLKKMTVYLKVTTDPSAYYRRYLKYMKKFFISESIIISITFFQNIYVDLGKDIVRNIVYYTC